MTSRREDRLVQTHKARSAEGIVFEIYEIQEWIVTGSERHKSYGRFEQPGGAAVNRLPNGDFELLAIDVIATPI